MIRPSRKFTSKSLGKVALPFDVTPRVWDAGTVTEDANGKAIGYVTSDARQDAQNCLD